MTQNEPSRLDLHYLPFCSCLAYQNSVCKVPGRFGPGSFRPILGVGRFGLGRWVISVLGRFVPESFRPNFNMVGYISMG